MNIRTTLLAAATLAGAASSALAAKPQADEVYTDAQVRARMMAAAHGVLGEDGNDQSGKFVVKELDGFEEAKSGGFAYICALKQGVAPGTSVKSGNRLIVFKFLVVQPTYGAWDAVKLTSSMARSVSDVDCTLGGVPFKSLTAEQVSDLYRKHQDDQ